MRLEPDKVVRGLFVWLCIAAFSAIYIHIGYLNEMNLNDGIDLGTYTQILWNTNQGNIPPYNTIKGQIAWGDHAHFALLLFAPIFQQFPSPITVLVIQVLAITTSAWAVYAISQKVLKSTVFSFIITLAYLSFFGIQYALDFDFHANVLTAAVFAWSVYAFVFERWPLYWLLLPIGLATREDGATFYVAFAIYVLLAHRKRYWKLALITIGLSVVYFFWVTYYLMPKWSPTGTPLAYFDAPVESHSPVDIAWWIVSQPVTVWQNMTQTSVARRTMDYLFKSFGYVPFASPFTYLLAAPNFLARFLSPEDQRHLMKYHYSASLASILAIGAIFGVAFMQRLVKYLPTKERVKDYLRHTILLVATVAIILGTYTASWGDVDLPIRQYQIPGYYLGKYRNPDAHDMILALLSIVPDTDSVATVGSLVPSFSARKGIYIVTYDGWEDADWVLLTNRFDSWPLSRKEVNTMIPQLRADPRYIRFFDWGGLFLFKKKSA